VLFGRGGQGGGRGYADLGEIQLMAWSECPSATIWNAILPIPTGGDIDLHAGARGGGTELRVSRSGRAGQGARIRRSACTHARTQARTHAHRHAGEVDPPHLHFAEIACSFIGAGRADGAGTEISGRSS